MYIKEGAFLVFKLDMDAGTFSISKGKKEVELF